MSLLDLTFVKKCEVFEILSYLHADKLDLQKT